MTAAATISKNPPPQNLFADHAQRVRQAEDLMTQVAKEHRQLTDGETSVLVAVYGNEQKVREQFGRVKNFVQQSELGNRDLVSMEQQLKELKTHAGERLPEIDSELAALGSERRQIESGMQQLQAEMSHVTAARREVFRYLPPSVTATDSQYSKAVDEINEKYQQQLAHLRNLIDTYGKFLSQSREDWKMISMILNFCDSHERHGPSVPDTPTPPKIFLRDGKRLIDEGEWQRYLQEIRAVIPDLKILENELSRAFEQELHANKMEHLAGILPWLAQKSEPKAKENKSNV